MGSLFKGHSFCCMKGLPPLSTIALGIKGEHGNMKGAGSGTNIQATGVCKQDIYRAEPSRASGSSCEGRLDPTKQSNQLLSSLEVFCSLGWWCGWLIGWFVCWCVRWLDGWMGSSLVGFMVQRVEPRALAC